MMQGSLVPFRLALVAGLLLFARAAPAQNLVLDEDGRESESQGGPTATEAFLENGEIVLTQTASQAIDFSGIVCHNTESGSTTDNSFWRLFDLGTVEEIEEAFQINSVDVGLGTIAYDGAPEQTGVVILYELEGDFRTENLAELGRTPFALASDLTFTRANVEVGEVVVPKSTRLAVQVAFPDCSGFEAGTCAFYPGVNAEGGADGTMGQWYITSDACEITQPMGIIGWVFGDQWWVLNVRGVEGTTIATEPEGGAEALALDVYPNPTRATATVALSLDTASDVRVAVYDVLGRAVAFLHDGPLAAGEYALAFEAAVLPAGVYLVRAEGGAFQAARWLTVLR